MFDMKLGICNADCVNFIVYCVLSLRVTCLFNFHYAGVEDMVGGLKGNNQDKRKDDKSMNICKGPQLWDEAWKPSTVSSVASDDDGSKCINEIVTETDESDDGSVKSVPPSGM